MYGTDTWNGDPDTDVALYRKTPLPDCVRSAFELVDMYIPPDLFPGFWFSSTNEVDMTRFPVVGCGVVVEGGAEVTPDIGSMVLTSLAVSVDLVPPPTFDANALKL